jgi:cytidylate kinase
MLQEKATDRSQRFIIAMDGPASSGKGTIAKLLADFYGLEYCCSGLFYRKLASAIVRLGLQNNQDIINLAVDSQSWHNSPTDDLYSTHISEVTSQIAAIEEVRVALYNLQRTIVANTNRLIMEGRDITTVIAPDADLKIYITANVNMRAKRRFEQLQKSGYSGNYETILEQLIIRDSRDENRSTNPLKRAKDALLLDSSELNVDNSLNFIINYVQYN